MIKKSWLHIAVSSAGLALSFIVLQVFIKSILWAIHYSQFPQSLGLPDSYIYLSVGIAISVMVVFIIIGQYHLSNYEFLSFRKYNVLFLIKIIIFNLFIVCGVRLLKIYYYDMQFDTIYAQYGTAFIMLPVAGEIICRGIIYNQLKCKMSISSAIVVSSLLTAIASIFVIPNQDIFAALLVFTASIVYAYCYEKTNTIWYAIILHAIGNIGWFVFQLSSNKICIIGFTVLSIVTIGIIARGMLETKKTAPVQIKKIVIQLFLFLVCSGIIVLIGKYPTAQLKQKMKYAKAVVNSEDNTYKNLVDATKIIPPQTGIVGSAANYLIGAEKYWYGVFIKDRTVTLSPYCIAKYEVTYNLWKKVYDWAIDGTSHSPYIFSNQGYPGFSIFDISPKTRYYHPVTFVSWADCVVWCNAYTEMKNGSDAECVYRMNKTDNTVFRDATNMEAYTQLYFDRTKKGYRLPTEAEWEYAARWQGKDPEGAANYGEVFLINLDNPSGSKHKWNNPYVTDVKSWSLFNSSDGTKQVGKKEANAFGLYDMSGNVWEWCFDWYEEIKPGIAENPAGPATGEFKSVRGGSWNFDVKNISVGVRYAWKPNYVNKGLGFRLAWNLDSDF